MSSTPSKITNMPQSGENTTVKKVSQQNRPPKDSNGGITSKDPKFVPSEPFFRRKYKHAEKKGRYEKRTKWDVMKSRVENMQRGCTGGMGGLHEEPQAGGLNPSSLALHGSSGCKSEVKVPAGWFSWDSSPWLQAAPYPMRPCPGWCRRATSLVSLKSALLFLTDTSQSGLKPTRMTPWTS